MLSLLLMSFTNDKILFISSLLNEIDISSINAFSQKEEYVLFVFNLFFNDIALSRSLVIFLKTLARLSMIFLMNIFERRILSIPTMPSTVMEEAYGVMD